MQKQTNLAKLVISKNCVKQKLELRERIRNIKNNPPIIELDENEGHYLQYLCIIIDGLKDRIVEQKQMIKAFLTRIKVIQMMF